MGIKKLNRNFVAPRKYHGPGFMYKTITVKDLLLYILLGIISLALLFVIIVIPFMVGRASVDCNATLPQEDENKSLKIDAATALINEVANQSEETEEEEIEEEIEDEVTVEEEPPEEEVEEEIEEETEEEYDEDARYLRTDERVATAYTDVEIDMLEFDDEIRGLDWGTINEMKIIITNNQDRIIIPYTLKMKIYNVGDHASDWWDDEVNLRDHLNIIAPDGYKILELDVHVSFSELDEKKRLALYLFDEVGKQMGSKIKEIEIGSD